MGNFRYDDRNRYRYALNGYFRFPLFITEEFRDSAYNICWNLYTDNPQKWAYREGHIDFVDRHIFRPILKEIENSDVKEWFDNLLGPNWHYDQWTLNCQTGHDAPVVAGIHGPAYPHDRLQATVIKNEQIFERMLVFSVSLVDVMPGNGGLGVVPGSHLLDLPFRDEWCDVRGYPHNLPFPITQVYLWKRDAVLFTEALRHGTLPWLGRNGPRFTIIGKFMSDRMIWSEDRRELLT